MVISTAVVFTTILLFIYLLVFGSSEPEYKYHNVVGKDTTAIFGDGKYEIFDINTDMGAVTINILEEDFVRHEVIMSKPEKYRVVDGMAYITGKEGFCVINTDTNLCKIFLYDMTESPMRLTKIVEDNDIVYLKSFDDFTSMEQKQFKITEAFKSEDSPYLIYGIVFLIITAFVLIIASYITVIYKLLKNAVSALQYVFKNKVNLGK